MKVLLTGGSGILGHYVIDELYKSGHTVTVADMVRIGDLRHSGNVGRLAGAAEAIRLRETWDTMPAFLQVDISNYGQVISALRDQDAVINLASRPTPFNYVEEDILCTNTAAIWNVCKAAEQLKIARVVIGSSYNAIGAQATAWSWDPRTVKPPEYFPLDEAVGSRAEDPYSISKWLGEHIADAFIRRSPWMSIASLRFSGIWDDSYLKKLREAPVRDAWTRCQGFWAYVFIADAARSCVQALDAPEWRSHERMFINASDTMIDVPTAEALKKIYPNVPLKRAFSGFESILDISAAKRVIGWEPTRGWRD